MSANADEYLCMYTCNYTEIEGWQKLLSILNQLEAKEKWQKDILK